MNSIQKRLCRHILQQHRSAKSQVSLVTVRNNNRTPQQSNTILNWLIEKHRSSALLMPSQRPATEVEEVPKVTVPRDFRYVYPDFLPKPDWKHRDRLRELLERKDMYRRRAIMDIPEFYVGSIMAVTVADPGAPDRSGRFVGICMDRVMNGLRSKFTLRNHIDGNGVEIIYDMYCPLVQKIQVLKLEKRLDEDLTYLRDCPPEYSTFPFDMEPVILPADSQVPLNTIKVPLGPRPWQKKWDRQDVKGIDPKTMNRYISKKEARRIERSAKPWEKYDLMKTYRETLNEKEIKDVMTEVAINKKNMEKKRETGKGRQE